MSERAQTVPRNVLITGAAKRVGRTIAEALASDGWGVAIHYRRSSQDADALVQRIRAAGGRAAAVCADLSRESEVAPLVDQATDALGPLGALINNASTFEFDDALSATRETWDAHMEANLRAPFVLAQSFARRLPERSSGCIVNIIDQRVWNLTPHFISYTLSKDGLWTLTRTLALALAPRIRVNAVGPGPTLPSPRQTDEEFARQCAAMPLERGTSPEEIADAVRFLLAAPAVTGQMIALDGGQHLGWSFPDDGKGPVE